MPAGARRRRQRCALGLLRSIGVSLQNTIESTRLVSVGVSATTASAQAPDRWLRSSSGGRPVRSTRPLHWSAAMEMDFHTSRPRSPGGLAAIRTRRTRSSPTVAEPVMCRLGSEPTTWMRPGGGAPASDFRRSWSIARTASAALALGTTRSETTDQRSGSGRPATSSGPTLRQAFGSRQERGAATRALRRGPTPSNHTRREARMARAPRSSGSSPISRTTGIPMFSARARPKGLVLSNIREITSVACMRQGPFRAHGGASTATCNSSATSATTWRPSTETSRRAPGGAPGRWPRRRCRRFRGRRPGRGSSTPWSWCCLAAKS